jgi:prolyl-tRNA synthetase
MAEEKGITVKKSENFSEWYTQVVLKSGLVDYGPVQGTIAFREYAYEIWEKIREIFDKMIKKAGHKNAYFPLLIPESFLKKEAEHFKGFVPEVFWVTQAGDRKLGERLAIRPTSETIIYHFYSKWIRSWRDLPILLNQWCNVARAEIKSTKPFIRTSEFLWQEGHTAHATKEEADKEVMKILKLYQELIENYLCIPVIVGKKSENEKFAGALYTTTLEAIMPDGKALQMGTSHNLGQNFSKAFDIKFVDKDGKEKYVWQTCWGISTRLIGAVVMVHGDDKGLILPPKIAPIQVVIVPIYYKKVERKKVLKKCKEVLEKLNKVEVRAIVDDREEYTPGWKFNEWELKGVPVRIEIGIKDIEKKQVVIARRDNFEKVILKEKELDKKILQLLESIQKNLFKRAKKFLREKITEEKDYNKFKEILEKKGGFIKACWCADPSCEKKIKEETGATIRVIPFKKEKIFSNCIYCGKEAKEVVYFARAY